MKFPYFVTHKPDLPLQCTMYLKRCDFGTSVKLLIRYCKIFRTTTQITKITPCPTQIIISLNDSPTGIIFFCAHPQVVYYSCVKFHQHLFILLGRSCPVEVMCTLTKSNCYIVKSLVTMVNSNMQYA